MGFQRVWSHSHTLQVYDKFRKSLQKSGKIFEELKNSYKHDRLTYLFFLKLQ